MLEFAVKLLGCQLQFLDQGGPCQTLSCLEGRVALRRREAIPRADLLTDITSEDPITDQRTQPSGDVVLQFNGKVGDAACSLNGPVGQDALGGASLNAACASPALIGNKRRIRFQFEIEKNLGQEEVRPVLRVDEAGVLADPAETGPLGQIAFENRARICIPAARDAMTNFCFDEGYNGL